MKEEISKLLKLTFLIHFFVSIIFGLAFTVIVELYLGFIGWPYPDDPITGRILGAMFLGLGAASLLAWRETRWENVKIIVQMEIVWLVIGIVVHFWGIFTLALPFMMWVQVVILIVFLVAFTWFYFDQEMGK
jgi:hypothetical protein